MVVGVRTSTGGSAAAAAGIGGGGGSGWNVKDLANRLNHRAGARTNHSFRPSWVKKNSPSHSHSHNNSSGSGGGGGGEGAESKESIEQEDPPRSNRSSNEHSHSNDETKSIPISMQERTTTASAPNMEQPTTKAISSSSSTEGKTHFWRSQTKASQSPQHNHANVDVSSTPCDRHRRVSVSPRRARLRGYKSELGGEGPPPPPAAAAGSTSISKSSGLSGSDSLTHKVHHVTQNQIRPTSLSPSRQRFGTRIQCGGGSGGEGEGTTEATFAKSSHSAGERKARNVNINGNGRATSPIRQRLWKAKFDTKVEKEDPAGGRDRDRDAGKDRGQAESQPPVREQEEQGPMNTNTNTNTKIQSFQSRIAQFSRGESVAAPATATATATAPATARASTGHESHGPSRSSFPKRSVETKVRSPAAGSGSNKGDMAPEGQGHVAHRPHQQQQQHHQQSQQPSQQRPIATEEEPTDPNPNGAAGGGDASEKFHFWKNQMNQRSRTNSVGIAKDGPVPPPVPVHSQSQPQPPRDSSDSRRMEGGSSKVVAHPHITTSRSETTEGMKRVHGANAVQQSQQSQQPKSGAGAGGGAAGGGVSQKAQFWLSQQHKKKQDADLASGKVRLKVHHVTPSSASSAPGSKDYSFPPPPPPQQQQQKSEDEAPSKASNGDLVTPPRSHANVSRGVAGGIGIGRTFSPTQSPKGTVSSAKSQPVQTKEEGSGQGTPIATGSGTPQNTSTSSGEYKTQYMQYMTSKNRRNAPQAELSFASNDDSNEMNAEQEEEFRRSMAKISERRGKVKRSWPPTSTPSNDEVDGVVVGEGRGEGVYESPMRETGRENAAQESPAFRIDSSRGNQMDSRDNTPKAQWNKTMERNATCASDKVHDARRNSHERYGRREVDIAHEGLNDRGPSFPNSTQSYNKHKSIGKSGSGKQPMNYHSEQRQSTAQAEEEGETSQSKVTKFKQYNRVAKNHNFTTPPPPPQDSLKKGDNTNLSMTPSRSTATTVISTDESQHMSNPWSTPQRQPVTYIMKDTGTPIKEEPEDDCHDTSTVITDTSSFLPVSEVKKKLWDDGEHLKQWRSDRAPIASEQPKPVEDEAQASLFKSRYYRAAEVAQQNCAKHNTLPSQPPNQYQLRQHSDAGVSKKQISSNAKSTLLSGRENRYYRAAEVAQKSSSDFQGQQVDDEPNYQGRKRHVDPAQKPLFSRDGTRERPNPLAATAEAMSDELRKGDKSVQQLLAKLRSVQRDDPNTALEKIDSIIESESNSMEHDEGKADAINESNEFPSEQPVEIDQNTVSDESGSSEYDSDDSTVSSITNPTYMSGFGDSFSYSRRQQFSQLVAKDGRLSPPYHSTRPSSFLTKPRQNDEGKARTPELPPRQPRQSSRNTTPLKGNHSTPNDPKARSVKSSVRPLAKSRNKTKPQLKSSISHPGSQPRSHDSDYIKPKSPIKSFAAKGNSINNRGLLNKFNTWGEDSSQEGEEVNAYDDHGGQSNVGSPSSERLKRLAEKITDKDSADHISKSGQNLLQSNRPRRFLYPQRSDSNEEHPVDTAGTEGGASWEPSSFFGTDFFEKDQTHENRTKREHFFKDGNNEFGSFRNNAFATKQLERKFSQVEKAYETNSPIF